MKALKLFGKKDLRYEETEMPTIQKATDVLIKVKAAGICGSDLSRYKKQGPYIPGMIWGHEFAGEVMETGSQVTKVRTGSHIVGVPTLVCDDLGKEKCYFCQKAEYARCEQLTVIGAYVPGAFAEYVTLPERNCILLPDSVDFDSAALIEPASVVLHGLYRTNLQLGDTVAVVGCGTIGLLAIKFAVLYGAEKIIAIDINDMALESAKKNGATHAINSQRENILEQLMAYTDGHMADVVVEAAGSPVTSAQVFAYAKKGGGVVFLGIPYSDVPIERFFFEKIVRSELTVWGSWNSVSAPYPGKEWSTIIGLLEKQRLNLHSIVTHRLRLEEGPEVFRKMTSDRSKDQYGKVLLIP